MHSTPARGTPAHGTPGYGTPGPGTPSRGTPAHGTPAHGTPAYGTPPHGTPGPGTPPHGTRAHGNAAPPRGTGVPSRAEGLRPTGTPGPLAGGAFVPRPRQEYVDAFDDDVFAAGGPAFPDEFRAGGPAGAEPPRGPRTLGVDSPGGSDGADGTGAVEGDGDSPERKSKGKGKGRAFTGVAAAAVTTVLAVVVAGQVADSGVRGGGAAQAAGDAPGKSGEQEAARPDVRPAPSGEAAAKPASYDEKMARKDPLDPKLTASGSFRTVGGGDKAPRPGGQLLRYRVDVEKGLPLDGELFAEAVHKTLNDKRSWAHGGGRAFERVSSGDADFVISLASPGTTATWCAKSGLDTTQDNVSCDSAATERVMINAYRWAQGAKTYGSKIYSYRQMLINHEVGHRLGFNHEGCDKQGALAPVMMQQTKYLSTDGVSCVPNAWPFP